MSNELEELIDGSAALGRREQFIKLGHVVVVFELVEAALARSLLLVWLLYVAHGLLKLVLLRV